MRPALPPAARFWYNVGMSEEAERDWPKFTKNHDEFIFQGIPDDYKLGNVEWAEPDGIRFDAETMMCIREWIKERYIIGIIDSDIFFCILPGYPIVRGDLPASYSPCYRPYHNRNILLENTGIREKWDSEDDYGEWISLHEVRGDCGFEETKFRNKRNLVGSDLVDYVNGMCKILNDGPFIIVGGYDVFSLEKVVTRRLKSDYVKDCDEGIQTITYRCPNEETIIKHNKYTCSGQDNPEYEYIEGSYYLYYLGYKEKVTGYNKTISYPNGCTTEYSSFTYSQTYIRNEIIPISGSIVKNSEFRKDSGDEFYGKEVESEFKKDVHELSKVISGIKFIFHVYGIDEEESRYGRLVYKKSIFSVSPSEITGARVVFEIDDRGRPCITGTIPAMSIESVAKNNGVCVEKTFSRESESIVDGVVISKTEYTEEYKYLNIYSIDIAFIYTPRQKVKNLKKDSGGSYGEE